MAMKIRLARGGSKKRPHYAIVAADSRMPRDGRFIEKLGTYNPMLPKDSEDRVKMNVERIKHWLDRATAHTQAVIDTHWNKIEAVAQQVLQDEIVDATALQTLMELH